MCFVSDSHYEEENEVVQGRENISKFILAMPINDINLDSEMLEQNLNKMIHQATQIKDRIILEEKSKNWGLQPI